MSDLSDNIVPGEKDEDVNKIDVMIMMDATGSMQRWINSARDTVLEAFDGIQKQYPNSHIRLGLVCYRDYGDKDRFVLHPLTENIQDVQTVLKNVIALGGNDTSEDVAGGLEEVLKYFREPHPSSPTPVRTVLFVADAPAHGLRYHSITIGDRYPKGDPDGREPYEQVHELAGMDVDLTIFRVDSSMDKMIEEFSSAYKDMEGTLTVLDVTKQPSSFSSAASFSSPLPRSCCEEESLTSGFIDLASYDEYDFRYSPSYAYRGIPSSSSPSCEDTFRTAAQTSVCSAVQKQKLKHKK